MKFLGLWKLMVQKTTPIQPRGVIGAPPTMYSQKMQFLGVFRPFLQRSLDKSFSTKHYVEIHVKIVHLKHKQFSCNDCGKLFTTKALDRHIKTKHLNNKYQKCHSCSVCKIYFIQERYLKQHISEFHKNSNPSLKWMKPLLPGPLVFINDLKNKPIMHSSFELK